MAQANFHTSYLLESRSEFGSSLQLDLCIDTARQSISGQCSVRRGCIHFDLSLNGVYTQLAGEGASGTPLQVELTGNPKHIPLRDSAFILRMTLSPDWKAGKADYELFSSQIDNALVTQDTARLWVD